MCMCIKVTSPFTQSHSYSHLFIRDFKTPDFSLISIAHTTHTRECCVFRLFQWHIQHIPSRECCTCICHLFQWHIQHIPVGECCIIIPIISMAHTTHSSKGMWYVGLPLNYFNDTYNTFHLGSVVCTTYFNDTYNIFQLGGVVCTAYFNDTYNIFQLESVV